MKDKKYKIGIVPGSFDPITVGHLDVILRAAELCEHVVVAVMINADKTYMFTLDERKQIAEAVLAGVENVEVISSCGMLYELSNALSADAIIKGVRNERDRKYEEMMAEYNSARTGAVTLLLDAAESLADVSSTAVRAMIENKENLDKYLSEGAINTIEQILKRSKK